MRVWHLFELVVLIILILILLTALDGPLEDDCRSSEETPSSKGQAHLTLFWPSVL